MSNPDRLGRIRRVALWLGAVELPLTLIWSVVGAGLYGSPLSEMTWESVPIVLTFFVLGGPLGLLPLAILSRWWPRLAGGAMLGGGACAFIIAMHPGGLESAVPQLYVDVGPGFVAVAMITTALGATMAIVAGGRRGPIEAAAVGGISIALSVAVLSAVQHREDSAPFRTHHPINFLAFGPDGRMLIAAGRSLAVYAPPASLSSVEVNTGRVKLLGSETSRQVLSADRMTFITFGREDTLIWDTRKLTVRSSWPRTPGPVAISTTGHAAIVVQGGLQLINLMRGGNHPVVKYDGESRWFAWSPDGGTLAIGRWKRGDVLFLTPRISSGGYVSRWDLAEITFAGRDLAAGQYSPDGRILAITDAGTVGRTYLWHTHERRELRALDEPAVPNSEWFAPDGRTLFTRSPSGSNRSLWDTATWHKKASLPAGPGLAWSPDSTSLAIAELAISRHAHRIVLRRTKDGVELRDLGSVNMVPRAVAFSPDGATVAVGGDGKILRGYVRGEIALFSARPQSLVCESLVRMPSVFRVHRSMDADRQQTLIAGPPRTIRCPG